MGGAELKPNASAVLIMGFGPRVSAPISAKPVLHDTASKSATTPPHERPEFPRGRSVDGGVNSLRSS